MTSDQPIPRIPSDPEALKKWASENLIHQKVVPQVVASGLDDNEPLLRFMDITKLFDLLVTKRLFLPTIGELMVGDPYECRAKKDLKPLSTDTLINAAKELQGYAPRPTHQESRHALNEHFDLVPAWRFEDQIRKLSRPQLEDTVSHLQLQKLKAQLVCACFYGSTEQSDAMWRIYASQVGVSIRTTAARLRNAFSVYCRKEYVDKVRFYLARVEYTESTTCTEELPPWLMKKRAYRHECEIRLYSEIAYELYSPFYLDVDLRVLLEAIEITPLAAPWQIRGIKAAISAMLKNAGVEVELKVSSHLRAPCDMWPPDQQSFQKLLSEATR